MFLPINALEWFMKRIKRAEYRHFLIPALQLVFSSKKKCTPDKLPNGNELTTFLVMWQPTFLFLSCWKPRRMFSFSYLFYTRWRLFLRKRAAPQMKKIKSNLSPLSKSPTLNVMMKDHLLRRPTHNTVAFKLNDYLCSSRIDAQYSVLNGSSCLKTELKPRYCMKLFIGLHLQIFCNICSRKSFTLLTVVSLK